MVFKNERIDICSKEITMEDFVKILPDIVDKIPLDLLKGWQNLNNSEKEKSRKNHQDLCIPYQHGQRCDTCDVDWCVCKR